MEKTGEFRDFSTPSPSPIQAAESQPPPSPWIKHSPNSASVKQVLPSPRGYGSCRRLGKEPEQILSSIPETLIYPVFVKPAHLGSSVGISKVSVQGELPEALAHACNLDTKVLIEQAMHGKEIEVAVLGNNDPIASACGEIEPGSDFYDYDDKYIHNTAKLFIPARLPEELSRRVQADALTAYRALGCRGMARVDFFVDEKSGQVVFNEINTIPGFTDISMYPQLMEAAGIAFPELCDRLLQLALEPEQPAKT